MRDERTSHCVSTAIVMSQYRKTGCENNVVYLPTPHQRITPLGVCVMRVVFSTGTQRPLT